MYKTAAIMQPYFLPYIGYWQLLNTVDEFVVYDNIKYTKKGWVNRNRYLCGNEAKYFTLPLESASDFLNVNERMLAASFNKAKLLNQLKTAYKNAPYFDETFALFEYIVDYRDRNLFSFLFNSISLTANHIGIKTKLITSSVIDIDHSLKAENKVIAICKALDARKYINPIGGIDLYSGKAFMDNGIELCFLKTDPIEYNQNNGQFIPALSIIDVLMFNGQEKTKELLKGYKVISESITRLNDIQLLISCLNQFDASTNISISERVGSLEDYARKLLENSNNFCVKRDEKIIGFISFYSNSPNGAYLTQIAVDGEEKGRGIGSMMLEYAMSSAKNSGMKRIRLEVYKDNTEAISFYLNKGFVKESAGKEASIYMTKEL